MILIMFAFAYGFGSSPLSYKEGPNLLNGPEMLEKKEQTENSLPLPSKCPKHGEILDPEEDIGFFFCEHITVLRQL